jgi:hypothetical protein
MSPPPSPTPYRNPLLELQAHCKPLIDALYTAIKFYRCSGNKDITLFYKPLEDIKSMLSRYNYDSGAGNAFLDYMVRVGDTVREIVEDQSPGGMEWHLEQLKKWLNLFSGENR